MRHLAVALALVALFASTGPATAEQPVWPRAYVVGDLVALGWRVEAARQMAAEVPVRLDPAVASDAGFFVARPPGQSYVVVGRQPYGRVVEHELRHAWNWIANGYRDDAVEQERWMRQLAAEADPRYAAAVAAARRILDDPTVDRVHWHHALDAAIGRDGRKVPQAHRERWYAHTTAAHSVAVPVVAR